MKKLGLVITDGVGFRNFITSNFLKEAHPEFENITIYSGLPKSAYEGFTPQGTIIRELDVFKEKHATWFFRKWKEIAHLRKYRSFYGMEDSLLYQYPKNNTVRSLLIKGIYFVTGYIHSNSSILFIERLQFLSFSRNKVTKSYLQILRHDKPDHLFFTHQRPSYLAPFLYASKKMKMRVSTFIFSWDNLASKGRMLGTFDYFLVWSDLMKKELLHFYPDAKEENVTIVGTPQFEPYVMDEYKIDRNAFFKRFSLDSAKSTICFSCADSSIGANDPIVIKAIAQAIRDNKIEKKSQLIVRTSPAENESRFKEVKKAYPEIIWNVPEWILTRENHAESWSQRVPSGQDIKDLRSLLQYCDLNINMCSTMSLDFMLFDKPVINTVFGNAQNGLYNDQRFLDYVHFKKVVDSHSVAVAKNENELIFHINEALLHPYQRQAERKAMIDLQIGGTLTDTSKRIVETLAGLHIH
jgi:hypothetical protein